MYLGILDQLHFRDPNWIPKLGSLGSQGFSEFLSGVLRDSCLGILRDSRDPRDSLNQLHVRDSEDPRDSPNQLHFRDPEGIPKFGSLDTSRICNPARDRDFC